MYIKHLAHSTHSVISNFILASKPELPVKQFCINVAPDKEDEEGDFN